MGSRAIVTLKKLLGNENDKDDGVLFEKLKYQINEEGSSVPPSLIQEAEALLRAGKRKAFLDQIECIKRSLIVFDISLFLELMEENVRAEKAIQDQEVILLLGPTGSGKSTTTYYLAGAKMRLTLQQIGEGQIRHIQGETNHPDLVNRVRISFAAVSETRFISPVHVSAQYVPGLDQPEILCDSPGFDDTRGAELDISNGLGFVAAIKRCKLVRPAVVCDSSNIKSNRMKTLKELIKTLDGVLPRLEQWRSSFSFIFTKCEPGSEQFLLGELENLKQSLSAEEKQQTNFVALLNEMIKQLNKQEAIVLDPLDNEPEAVFRKIRRKQGIRNPGEEFQNFVSSVSYNVLQEQIRRHQLAVLHALKANKVEVAAEILRELQLVSEILKSPAVDQLMSEIKRQIESELRGKFHAYLEVLKRIFDDGNSFQQDDTKTLIAALEGLEAYGRSFPDLANNLVMEGREHFKLQYSSAAERVVVDDTFLDYQNMHRLDKLKAFCEYFPELRQLYQDAAGKIEKKCQFLSELVKSALAQLDFDTVGRALSNLQTASLRMHNHVPQLPERYKMTTKLLKDSINTGAQLVVANFDTDTPPTSAEVSSSLEVLRRTQSSPLLKEQLDDQALGQLNQLLLDIVSKVKIHMSCYLTKVKTAFVEDPENALCNVERLVLALRQFSEIPGMPADVRRVYDDAKTFVLQRAHLSSTELRRNLQALKDGQSRVDYKALAASIAQLKQASWVEQLAPGTFQLLLDDVDEQLRGQVEAITHQVESLHIELGGKEDQETAGTIVATLLSMRPVEKFLPDLEQKRNAIFAKIAKNAEDCLSLLSKFYSLDRVGLTHQEDELRGLEADMHECEKLHPLVLYLQENQVQSIEELETKVRTDEGRLSEEREVFEIRQRRYEEELANAAAIAGEVEQTPEKSRLAVLKDKGFVNLKELTMAIQDKKANLERLKRQHQETTHKIEVEIQTSKNLVQKAQTLQNGSPISPQVTKHLASKGYNSLSDLESRVKDRKQQVAKARSEGLAYTFPKLDAAKAQEALEFVTWSLSALVAVQQLRKPAMHALEELRTYVKRYSEFLEELIRRLRVTVDVQLSKRDSIGNQELFEATQSLRQKLHEWSEISSCFPKVFQLFGDQKLASAIDVWLDDHALNLSLFLTNSKQQGPNSLIQLQGFVAQAKALSQLDSYCKFGKAKTAFLELFRKYQPLLVQGAGAAGQLAFTALDAGDFRVFGLRVTELANAKTEEATRQATDLRAALAASMLTLGNEAKLQVIMLSTIVSAEWLKDLLGIKSLLDKMLSALQLVPAHLGISDKTVTYAQNSDPNTTYSDQYSTMMQQLCKDLTEKLLQVVKTTLNAVQACRFVEAQTKMDIIRQARGILSRYLSPQVAEAIDSYNKVLNDALARHIAVYEGMSVVDLPFQPPKDLYIHLKESDAQECKDAWTTIASLILVKFRNEFKAIQEASRRPDTRATLIRKLELAIKSLPERERVLMQHELEDIKASLEQEAKDLQDSIKNAVEAGSVKQMEDLAKDVQAREGAQGPQARALGVAVRDKLAMLKSTFDAQMASNQHAAALATLLTIEEYRTLESAIPGVLRDCLAHCVLNVKGVFSKVCNTLVKLASEESGILKQAYSVFSEFAKFFEVQQVVHKQWTTEHFGDVLPFVNQVTIEIKSYSETLVAGCQRCRAELDAAGLKVTMEKLAKIDPLLRAMQKESPTPQHVLPQKPKEKQDSDKTSENPVSYAACVQELNQLVTEMHTKLLEVALLNDQTKEFDSGRKDFFNKLNRQLGFFRKLVPLADHANLSASDVEKMQDEVEQRLLLRAKELHDKAVAILRQNARLNNTLAREFTVLYECVKYSKNCFSIPASVAIVENYIAALDRAISVLIDASLAKVYASKSDMQSLLESLVAHKQLGESFPHCSQSVNVHIDECVETISKQTGGHRLVTQLAALLNAEQSGLGATVVNENTLLRRALVNPGSEVRRRTHNIDIVLNKLRSNQADIDTALLKTRYLEFEKIYTTLKNQYLKPAQRELGIVEIAKKLKSVARSVDADTHAPNKVNWNASLSSQVPEVMAHIFAMWTLHHAAHYFDIAQQGESENDKDLYLYIPHAAQVVCLMRIFGIGYVDGGSKKEEPSGGIFEGAVRYITGSGGARPLDPVFANTMIQVGTGEGKSVIIAVTSIVLALFGIQVRCACYSKYLSRRDYADFEVIFKELGVDEHIKYGTFDEICEDTVNENGEVRLAVKNLIQTNTWPVKNSVSRGRPRVLVVDEVDVFFNQDFYGNLYNLATRLAHPTISALVRYIWDKRDSLVSLDQVKSASQYTACVKHFGAWSVLIDEAIKDMIAALKTYNAPSHRYVLQDGRIGYQDQDEISTDVTFGYNTMFAYFNEHHLGRVPESVLESNIYIQLKCGSFSYAEIPNHFCTILGVTGTLEHLSPAEKAVMQSYNIRRETYMPSVYGDNQRQFAANSDVRIEELSSFYTAICDEVNVRIKGRQNGKRAVLVFFETREKLFAFRESPITQPLLAEHTVLTLSEEVTEEEKKACVKQATRSGVVLLVTKSFGRGTDFISYSPTVNDNGGVHVLQTFLSEEQSEEVQIMGRTARQGQSGSYSIVLLDSELEKYSIDSAFIKQMRDDRMYHHRLKVKRNEYFSAKYQENARFIHEALAEHRLSAAFIQALYTGPGALATVKSFLGERNRGATLEIPKSRIIVLMDGTGSMGHLIHKAKNTVNTMFERAAAVLKDNGIPSDSFQLQFAVYRDYDCKDDLLQTSCWAHKPEDLRVFMEAVSAHGGGDLPEAVEVGLWNANEEATAAGLAQVILIGDAPAKNEKEIAHDRQMHGESHWRKIKYAATPTVSTKEAEKLAARGIPINAFYMHKQAQKSFETLAGMTKGVCAYLDVNGTQGATLLTDTVTEQILGSVGQATGAGETYKNQYRAKYKTVTK